jgi:branched-chain amino acid transport system permease protein
MSWSMSRLRVALTGWGALALILVLILLAHEFLLDRSLGRVAVSLVLTIGIVIAIQTFTGNSGILSFGHLVFFGLAAYFTAFIVLPVAAKQSQTPGLPTYLLEAQYPPIVAVLVSVAAGLVVGALSGAFIARMKAAVVGMATLALLVASHTVINAWGGVTNGNQGLASIPKEVDIVAALVTTAVIAGVALLFAASPAGLRLQATREDEDAARALGISVGRARFWGWLISAVLSSLAGSVWALNVRAFAPDQFYFEQTFAILAMLVVGGIGSVSGAVVGALGLTVLTELARSGQEAIQDNGGLALPGLIQLTTAAIIIIALILRPQGLLGGKELGISGRSRMGNSV